MEARDVVVFVVGPVVLTAMLLLPIGFACGVVPLAIAGGIIALGAFVVLNGLGHHEPWLKTIAEGMALVVMLAIVVYLYKGPGIIAAQVLEDGCDLPRGFYCDRIGFASNGSIELDLGQTQGGELTITRVGCGDDKGALVEAGDVKVKVGLHRPLAGNATGVDLMCCAEGAKECRSTLWIEFESESGVARVIHGDVWGTRGSAETAASPEGAGQ